MRDIFTGALATALLIGCGAYIFEDNRALPAGVLGAILVAVLVLRARRVA